MQGLAFDQLRHKYSTNRKVDTTNAFVACLYMWKENPIFLWKNAFLRFSHRGKRGLMLLSTVFKWGALSSAAEDNAFSKE